MSENELIDNEFDPEKKEDAKNNFFVDKIIFPIIWIVCVIAIIIAHWF